MRRLPFIGAQRWLHSHVVVGAEREHDGDEAQLDDERLAVDARPERRERAQVHARPW